MLSLPELTLFFLLLLAIAIGWLLGRKPDLQSAIARWQRSQETPDLPPYQFDSTHDQALDNFIQALNPSADNLDWHMGLARLMRQQGEFERAIRIHQSLLASGLLAPQLSERVQFELVQDYLKAGLQDRAEALLLALLNSSRVKQPYLMCLLDLYQRQQAWQRAIDIAQQLTAKRGYFKQLLEHSRAQPWWQALGLDKQPKDRQPKEVYDSAQAEPMNLEALGFQLAHFYCQLAQQSSDLAQRYRYIKQALQADKFCQRARLAAFEIEVATKQWPKAAKSLAKINSQAPQLLLECRTPLRDYFMHVSSVSGYLDFLAQWVQRLDLDSPWCLYLEALAQENLEQALLVLEQRLAERSSLPLLALFARLQCEADQAVHSSLPIYQQQLADLQQQNHHKAYQCKQCGFEAQSLHWQCPSCFSWAKMALKY